MILCKKIELFTIADICMAQIQRLQILKSSELNSYLYLIPVSSSNVWDGPASFFLDTLFMIMSQQAQ